jgi:IclR family acetate operon transcriptional repressor
MKRPVVAVADTIVRLDEALGGAPTLKPFAFLETIAQAQRALSVSEMSALLNVPQPTAHRIVHMLESDGFLEREAGTRRYAPGARLVRLGFGVVAASARAAPRRAILETLSKSVNETCNFGIQVGNHLMYLDRIEASWPFGLRFEPGSRVPLHCTAMGKLFLSFMPPVQRQRLLTLAPLHHYTEHTITDPVLLQTELDRIRKADVSTDNQEFLAGVVCVAVPVRAPNGNVAASLAVSAPLARMSMKRAMQLVPLLRAAADRIAGTFGHANGTDTRTDKKHRG